MEDFLNDAQCAIELLRKVKLDGKTFLGDKTFSSAPVRDFIQVQKAKVNIPDKVNSAIRPPFDRELYKARNVVDSNITFINTFRSVFTLWKTENKADKMT